MQIDVSLILLWTISPREENLRTGSDFWDFDSAERFSYSQFE